ncbi:mitochondrial protein from FMP27-domain-containing protein [Phyllosticta citriasiana]|uniref:Mitochondrial protein from FMP27-domain-containing protein n=1 Tax=Phyllosticta citriasiana TaxID=595635 RepID=A0ABR1KUJ9_9PEZI
MAFSLSALSGLVVLLYLSTFVIFALVRVVTGVSIQRLGWYGLRRISFTPKDGIRLDIRGLRISLHRPTFAQPTYVSVVVEELKLTVDLKALGEAKAKGALEPSSENGLARELQETSPAQGSESSEHQGRKSEDTTRTWQKLTDIKERIKKLHRQLDWIRMFDIVATTTSLVIEDVGSVQIAQFTAAVDTRRKMVDRSRLFQHRRAKSSDQSPAEWIFTVRNVLFSPEGQESTEILDHFTLNIHGLLYKELDGLRDASIALKLGRLHIPFDEIEGCLDRVKAKQKAHLRSDTKYSLNDLVDELDRPGSHERDIVQTVSDSKEFISSTLRGIQEIQFAVSFFGLTKRIRSGSESERPVYLNMSMKEVGFDLLRLDPRSPAHLMYFGPQDVAHQALLAAISISVGIDHGQDNPERLLYIPMATTTLKTTLPAKTIQIDRDRDVAERNANILFANFVVTSPSFDLDPKHLPLILALLQSPEGRNHGGSRSIHTKRHIISRLLPKANVKFSIHEPVVRVTLPPMESGKKDSDEFDLLISTMSSISLDVEASHSGGGELHYAVSSNFRITGHELYYQTASREKHNLLVTDAAEVKLQLEAFPEVSVVLAGNLETFNIFMVRPEISEGVRQIVAQLRTMESSTTQKSSDKPKFLRTLPKWLTHLQFHGSDFNVEVAGVDPDVSKHSRGVALHLDTWTAEYKADKSDDSDKRLSRRRATSRSVPTESQLRAVSPSSPPSSPAPRKRHLTESDGRRLAIHIQGLEGFTIESSDSREEESFLRLPNFEVAFTTSTDIQGPVFHINAFARSLFVHYSLYRHFALGVAAMVLRRAFVKQHSDRTYVPAPAPKHQRSLTVEDAEREDRLYGDPRIPVKAEIVTIDFKVAFVQIKATVPDDPPLMLQIYGFDAGRHRWAPPFARAKLARLFAEAPGLKKTWARMVSIKSLKVDLRSSRRKFGNQVSEEKSIDIGTDAVRVAVPHQLVVHKVFDNVTNTVKTVEQLHHRFKTGSNEYILEKGPEAPKKVPRISIRSQALLFEIEDSSFEWKLGTIFRLGLLEQRQRMAREDAFALKVKKLKEGERRRGNTSNRARSAHMGRGRSQQRPGSEFERRSKSLTRGDGKGGTEERGRRRMRYDVEGASEMSDSTRVHIAQAREKLDRLHAQSWRNRIDQGLSSTHNGVKDIRAMFWGLDDMPDGVEQQETILAIPQRPALMAFLVSDLHFVVDKPSFPLSDYPTFLNRIGKGMPVDMQYSLLIPLSVQISMGEARMNLRDYPLPFLHIPAMRTGQSTRLPSFSLKTDFVIAEEFRDRESSRQIEVEVVPPEILEDGQKSGGFIVNVRKTIAPVKTYSDMSVDVNTSFPTRITWGSSYQPAIQDMMQVIEGFTKAPVDPSEKVGFWDKIRLSFHSKIRIAWKGDGDVHLILKGSRDPYKVTGDGAGFVMCWRNDVRLNVCQDDDPKKFITVDSGVYVLAIPDLSHYARSVDQEEVDNETVISSSNFKHGASFRKTVMKLSGNVRWLVGLVFEKAGDNGKRSFDFAPHYNVILRHPDYAKSRDGKEYDAFRGFRSHHIHMSVAIAAPHDRDWSVANTKASSNYNSLHLTPRVFSHFFSWWSLFSGAMQLPVRQGPLWPGVDKSGKKFGRHLGTIKFGLLLSPLYMSHIYKHKDPDDYGQGVVSATGLKVRLDSFMLDLHMRREEFRSSAQGANKSTTTTGMRINQVQLDFMSADIRAISARITGPENNDLEEETEDTLTSFQQDATQVDLSKFTIPDNDLSWVDMDDFVELDWILPSENNPETKILPLAFAPRFTYFRQTDHQDHISGDPHRTSIFGNEPTHYCVMSKQNDPRRVQCELIADRLKKVHEQLESNNRSIGEQQLRILRSTEEDDLELEERLRVYQHHHENLQRKRDILQSMYHSLIVRLERDENSAVASSDADDEYYQAPEMYDQTDKNTKKLDATPLADYISDFNNRFVIHNAQVKWNNALRNIILRYIHQVSQRRGFVYYMSRRAVKFILDIIDEQSKSRQSTDVPISKPRTASTPMSPKADDDLDVNSRIQQLLQDGRRFVDANDPAESETNKQPSAEKLNDDIAQEFTAQNTYHVRLIAPQIQLQSEKNLKSAVLVTAKGMQLKVIQVMDRDRVEDDVSGLVQRRFSAAMDSLQIFVTSTKTFSTEYLHMYSGNRYGASVGSSWPPWVPFEVMFEFDTNPYGFSRVVQRTSASLRYDKYNTLRLKYNDDVSGEENSHANSPESAESRVDHLWVEFPHVRAVCDSMQYYAMYIIVLDLLLYSEPLEKQRSEKLEKIMLASDFSDLNGAPELVVSLQERIHQLEEIKTRFQIHEQYLDREGWKNRIELERTLAENEEELFFMMKAITTSQRKTDDRAAEATQPMGLLRYLITASEIVWHLVREGEESLAEFQLGNASFDRTDNSDGSNLNCMEIERIHGLNLLPEAVYPEMIAPYLDESRSFFDGRDAKMLRIHWYMLEAIAGIPVMDHFEVNLFPLKVQLEREIGKKLFEYIFPGVGSNAFENGGFSPFMVKHILPPQEEGMEVENGDDQVKLVPDSPQISRNSSQRASIDGSGPGSLELRLQPTLALPDQNRPKTSSGLSTKKGNIGSHFDLTQFKMFDASSRTGTGLFRNLHTSSGSGQKDNSDTLTISSARPSSRRSSATKLPGVAENEKSAKRGFGMHRSPSSQRKERSQSDDLNQMMTRASNYMTFAYIKIPSMVLCLSYKGKGNRNVEDVHDLVFRMPTIEYRNKTWSNLDLALALKKDVIRALISHAGTILNNKFSHHRPNKGKGVQHLKQLANPSIMLNTSSEVSSTQVSDSSRASPEDDTEAEPRRSFASGRDSAVSRADSYSSSARSVTGTAWTGGGLNAHRSEDPTTFADELSVVDFDRDTASIRHAPNTLHRAITAMSHRSRDRDDDSEESNRMKSKLLLGKKFVKSLGQHK